MALFYHFILMALLACKESLCQLSQNKDELLNWCLNSRNHKKEPGKEYSLHDQCRPWKDHACCTESVTQDIHELNLYNFTHDHCYSQVKRNMSPQCKKYFIRDNCFYECEPHIGFWVVNTTRKISSERYFKVPLCSKDCDEWFEACKDDYTCVYNWPRDFKFQNGQNTCPENSQCLTFQKMYKSAKAFCENVWDHSWKYAENEPCMHLWFDGSIGDINKKVAEYYIDKMFSLSNACTFSHTWYFFLFVLVLAQNVIF